MSAVDLTIDAATAAAYLRRLGLAAEPPSSDALARLHRAQVERVPYETFWIHIGQPWGIAAAESSKRAARTGRGGYCFQLNGAFAALLHHLGYRVTMHVGGVHGSDGPDAAELTNHLALIVEGCPTTAVPDGRWYVDAGLGDGLYEPLPLVPGRYRQGSTTFVLDAVAAGGIGDWQLTNDPNGSFTGVSIVEHSVDLGAFAERHAMFASSPESPFAKVVTAQRRVADGPVILRGCVLTRGAGPKATTTIHERRGDWLDLLEAEFGLRLDAPEAAIVQLWSKVWATHEAWLAEQAAG